MRFYFLVLGTILLVAVGCQMDGTFSAEHGIGQLKRDELARTKAGAEIELMRRLKTVFDPNNILNPGKLV